MKLSAMLSTKTWSSIIRKMFDKKTFAVAIVVFFAITVPGSEKINAANEAPNMAALHTELTPEQAKLLGACNNSSSIAFANGTIYEKTCSTGAVPALMKTTIEVFTGVNTDELSSLFAPAGAISYDNRLELAEKINRNSNSSLVGTSINFNYTLAEQRPGSGLLFTEEIVARTVFPDVVAAQNSSDIQPYFPGTGFELLRPIQQLWGWFVGITYGIMIFLIVGVALALMFRQNLGGEQTIQLQTAIPGIVLAMILIPLSYSISGLFIDGITLGSNMIHGFMFGPIGALSEVYESEDSGLKVDSADPNNNRGLYIDDPRLSIFGFQSLIGLNHTNPSFRDGLRNIACPDGGGLCTAITGVSMFTGGLQVIFWLLGTTAGETLIDLFITLLYLFFVIIIFFTALRLGWKLFKQFLTMMALPVISPLIFASLAVPGRGNSLVIWYLKRMGNVTINYLVAYGVLILSAALASPAITKVLPQGSLGGLSEYQPPLIAGSVFSLLIDASNNTTQQLTANANGDTTLPLLFLLLSLGLFIMLPGILQQITDSLAPKEENPIVKLFGQEFGATTNLAFKQAPGITLTAGRRAYQGVRPFTKMIGSRRGLPHDKTFAEKQAGRMKSWSGKISKAPVVGGLASRAADTVFSGVAHSLGDETYGGAGDEAKINVYLESATKKDHPDYVLLRPQDPGQDQGAISFTILDNRPNQKSIPEEIIFTGTLVIEVPKGSKAPRGKIAFANYKGNKNAPAPENCIAYLPNTSSSNSAVMFQLDENVIEKTSNVSHILKMSIGPGNLKQRVNFTAKIPKDSQIGTRYASQAGLIDVRVGQTASKKPVYINIGRAS